MRQKGFTIVEILIVVIVIAILATITITSYNGLISRANATKTIALVNQWQKTIQLYQSTSGVLPNDWTCLGNDVTDFPASSGDSIGLGQCERNFIVAGQPSDWTSEYKTVPTQGQTRPTAELLRQNVSSSQGLLDKHTGGGNSYMRGIIYASIFDPALAPQNQPGAFIFYTLRGQPCAQGVEHRTVGVNKVCAIRLTSNNYMQEIFQP